MMCQKPFKQGVIEFGCGQCLPCRINRRRVWTARLLLESMLHERVCFLTLTYDQEHLPPSKSLNKVDYVLFLKRLRRALEPEKISFYMSAEYGDVTGRPHYHIVIFGFDTGRSGSRRLELARRNQLNFYNQDEKLLLDCWKMGNVHVGELNEQSAAYACKHLVKEIDDSFPRARDYAYYIPKRIFKPRINCDGKLPVFARMSLNPAIGKRAVRQIAEYLNTEQGSKYVKDNYDVPAQVRFGGRKYQIGSYLRKEIRQGCGMDKKWNSIAKFNASMRLLDLLEEKGPDAFEGQRKTDKRRAQNTLQRQKLRRKL